MNRHKLPIGVSNFQELVQGGYLFCDKTKMIADFLDKGDKVTLITRPRRWGKTLNMSMLQHFFASAVNGVATAGLFDGLAIGKIEKGKYLEQYQGKHPVIMLSFKDVNASDFSGAYDSVYLLIKKLYGLFEYLLASNKLNSDQRYEFNAILNRSANQQQLEKSLELLSECLYQHHGKKVYMLIDEYDTPLNKAYGNNDLIKQLLLSANDSIKKQFEQLMQGEALTVPIDKHIAFDLLDRNKTALWSLLLFAGYLTFQRSNLSLDSDLYDCIVEIPNQEIHRLYNRFFAEWLSSKFVDHAVYNAFLGHLVVGIALFYQEKSAIKSLINHCLEQILTN